MEGSACERRASLGFFNTKVAVYIIRECERYYITFSQERIELC